MTTIITLLSKGLVRASCVEVVAYILNLSIRTYTHHSLSRSIATSQHVTRMIIRLMMHRVGGSKLKSDTAETADVSNRW